MWDCGMIHSHSTTSACFSHQNSLNRHYSLLNAHVSQKFSSKLGHRSWVYSRFDSKLAVRDVCIKASLAASLEQHDAHKKRDNHGHNHHDHHDHHHHHHEYSESNKVAAFFEATGIMGFAERLEHNQSLLSLSILSFALSALLSMSSWQLARPVHVSLLACTYLILGFPQVVESSALLADGKLDTHVLMTLAIIGTLLMSMAHEGALLLLLFRVSHFLEGCLTAAARSSLSRLLASVPATATRVQVASGTCEPLSESAHSVPVSKVVPGQYVMVKTGEQVPLDGEIVWGTASLSVAHISGEGTPVSGYPGLSVAGGSLMLEGVVVVRVSARARDSTPARLARLTSEAAAARPRIGRTIDALGSVWSRAVLLAAAATLALLPLLCNVPLWGAGGAVYRALGVLAAGAPCALVLAPLAYVCGIGVLAARGVIVKGGAALDAIAEAGMVALDKTGTITTGQLSLTSCSSLHAGENGSNQILARAISLPYSTNSDSNSRSSSGSSSSNDILNSTASTSFSKDSSLNLPSTSISNGMYNRSVDLRSPGHSAETVRDARSENPSVSASVDTSQKNATNTRSPYPGLTQTAASSSDSGINASAFDDRRSAAQNASASAPSSSGSDMSTNGLTSHSSSMYYAAALSELSTHPVSKTLAKLKLSLGGDSGTVVYGFRQVPGRGIEGVVGAGSLGPAPAHVVLGSLDWVAEAASCSQDAACLRDWAATQPPSVTCFMAWQTLSTLKPNEQQQRPKSLGNEVLPATAVHEHGQGRSVDGASSSNSDASSSDSGASRSYSGGSGSYNGASSSIDLPAWCSSQGLETLAAAEVGGPALRWSWGSGGEVCVFRFEDQLRPGVAGAVQQLRSGDWTGRSRRLETEVVMLTGDSPRSAAAVAASVGISDVRAGLKPSEKLAAIAALQKEAQESSSTKRHGVVMVGDGLNDAPALAGSAVGIALVASPIQLLAAAADVVVVNGQGAAMLPSLFRIARQTQRVVKANVCLALFSVAAATLPTVAGFFPLWLAVLLHEGATLLVALNCLTLLAAEDDDVPENEIGTSNGTKKRRSWLARMVHNFRAVAASVAASPAGSAHEHHDHHHDHDHDDEHDHDHNHDHDHADEHDHDHNHDCGHDHAKAHSHGDNNGHNHDHDHEHEHDHDHCHGDDHNDDCEHHHEEDHKEGASTTHHAHSHRH